MGYQTDKTHFGGKAEGLLQLKNAGLPVPEFIVIPSEEAEEALKNADKMAALCRRIENKFPKAKLAVRSSADKEDGQTKSYAGFFSTVLNVEAKTKPIGEAIKKVCESSKRTALDKVHMNIVVQTMVKPLIAGVCFSDSTDENNQKLCVVSFVKGLANKLVDGKLKATNVFYKIKNNKICGTDFSVHGTLPQYVGYLSKLMPLVQKIRDEIYQHADIEWCIDKNGYPWIVQLRPITQKVYISQESAKYVIASNGVVRGKAYCIDSSLPTEELKTAIDGFKKGAILVSEYTDTFFMPAINKASAILTSEGDILSHSAITARELNIPCLVGVRNLLSKVKSGDDIYINTYKNILEINGVNFSDTSTEVDWTSVYDFSNVTELNVKKDLLLFENAFGEYILYHNAEVSQESIEEAVQRLSAKFKGKIQISDSNKYHWYFEWKNFNRLSVFRKYFQEALYLAQDFCYEKVSRFYEDVFEKCLEIKNNKALANDLIRHEMVVSLYFLLDMVLPMGISMKYAYLKAFPLLGKNVSFSSLLAAKPLKDKALLKIQKYLAVITKEKNTIFQKFMDADLLSYDFMQLRDKQIRSLFDEKYPKYSATMYQLFYKKYVKDIQC